MDHLLTCSCGKEFTVSRSQAGQEIKCDCGQMIAVPTLRGFSELPTAGEVEKVSAAWGGWRGPTMALFSAICLVAAIFAARFLFQGVSVDTSYTAESEVAAANEIFDEYGADELSMVWDHFETNGIGPKVRPDFYLWNKYARERMILASIAGSVTGVFGLLAIGVWMTAPKKEGAV